MELKHIINKCDITVTTKELTTTISNLPDYYIVASSITESINNHYRIVNSLTCNIIPQTETIEQFNNLLKKWYLNPCQYYLEYNRVSYENN